MSISIFNFDCASHTHTHTHTHARARAPPRARTRTPKPTLTPTFTRTHAKNFFSRTFYTSKYRRFLKSREYGDHGFLKIKGIANTWSAISRLQIDETQKIQRDFEEYDFGFKILNWATLITCFTCLTFLLLTASFLRIFYETRHGPGALQRPFIR